jgi:hypothetical protein
MKWFYLLLVMCFSFGAMSEEKYKTGLVIPKDWKSKAKFESNIRRGFGVPADFDWRTQKTLSPIMQQGNCGSCWAFSASATFRDNMIVQGGSLFTNSTQQVLDCNGKGYGCNGGFFDVDDYFVSPGVSTESAYGAYVAKQNQCKNIPATARAISWHYVAQTSSGKPSDAEIKAAIYQWGPVSVGVAVDSNFQNYSGGVFTNCTGKQLNHAVQLVGWSDSGGYWIMRNSWGTSWGEQGYMRLKYGCDGIGEAANYFKLGDSPTPDPTPGPNPDPTPGPSPDPTPPPCVLPVVTTGYADQYNARKGSVYIVGKRGVKGVTYIWSAEPSFSNGAVPTTAQIRYQPAVTKRVTVTATNSCGSNSASTSFNLPASSIYH